MNVVYLPIYLVFKSFKTFLYFFHTDLIHVFVKYNYQYNFSDINNRGLVVDTTFGCQVSSFFVSWHLISPGSFTSHPTFKCVSALKLMTQLHSGECQLYLNKTGNKH